MIQSVHHHECHTYPCPRTLPSILHLHPCVANVLAVPMEEEVTAAVVEEDTTIVVDLPRLLLEVDMVVDLIRIVLHLDILLLGVGTILLRRDETMPTRRVGAMIMFRRGSRVRDTMMIVLGGDRLQTLEGEERTMEGVIGEHPFFCAGIPLRWWMRRTFIYCLLWGEMGEVYH